MEENTKVTTIEQIQEARDIRYILHERELYSEERSNEASIEFSRLEIQIAVVLLGLIGVFWNVYFEHLKEVINSGILIKFLFGVVLFLLVSSLTLGLLHLKITENFWDRISLVRTMRFNKWQEVILGKASFGDALAYQEGTKIGNGAMIQVPSWVWILQSVLLGASIVIILVMAIAFIILS